MPRWVRRTVSNGIILRFHTIPTQTRRPFQRHFNAMEQALVDQELAFMLASKATVLAPRWEPGRFFITFFLARTGQKRRVVFNLPPLNDFLVDAPSFRSETLSNITTSILPGDFGVRIDLKKAYWGLRIPPPLRKFFCFQWGGRTYQLASLPLGLKVAPFIFQSVMKAVTAQLRHLGIRVLVYIDDVLILHQDRNTAHRHAQIAVNLLDTLGFVVSQEKTDTTPLQQFLYLGLDYDTRAVTVSAPPSKLRDIRRQAKALAEAPSWTARETARLIGKITFLAPAAREARLHLQHLHTFQRETLRTTNQDWDLPRAPSEDARRTARWWARCPLMAGTSFAPVNEDDMIQVEADAGPRGLGAVMQDGPIRSSAAARWRAGQMSESTNVRELRALLFALRKWHHLWTGRTVRLTTDSQVAFRYVKKVTGKHEHLSRLAAEINRLAIRSHIRLIPRQVPGEQIPEADRLSRLSDADDFRLTNAAFAQVEQKLGRPTADLFASRFTAKAPRFFTRYADPMAAGQNAFRMNWRNEDLPYAFPPPKLLPRTIRKIVADRARAILVMPTHWGNPWLPLIRSLSKWNLRVAQTLRLPPGSVADTLPRRESTWNWTALLLDAREAPPWQ